MGQTSITNLASEFQPTAGVSDQSLAVEGTSVAFIATALNENTQKVVWTVHDAGVFVTFDGDAATTSNGHLIASGTSGEWSVATAEAAKVIREAGVSARIHISEFQTR